MSGIVLLTALYVLLMSFTVDLSRVDADTSASDRDAVYFALHLGLVVAAAGIGFAMGKWLNGLGFAYAVLFVTVLIVLMLAIQLGSFSLACEGHNDIIRHWQCEG
ncbi:MAG: hypothetical protein IT303_11400 [Dehalococcoidia bacterium]|nr:hypothetical protein [Dehalococcoidia bacterium]